MTTEQKYHRRLARKYGKGAVFKVHWVKDNHDYDGAFSVYCLAKSAAWHAFKAHPELREENQNEH